MSDTSLHDLCKGFGSLMSRSKNQTIFAEEASRLNERGNLPLHAACSFQAPADVVETLLRAYPAGASQPNSTGNLPIHQAAMLQAPVETVELLLSRFPEGATVRNQYGSLPLHMAASNQASPEVVRLLIASYQDALHLQNDDGMTPLDLAEADESVNESVTAMLEGRPPPPELTRRQKAEKYEDRTQALERKISNIRNSGGRQDRDLKLALAAVRRLADRFPHALYSAGMDPNELEIAFSDHLEEQKQQQLQQTAAGRILASPPTPREEDAEMILLDAVRKRTGAVPRDRMGMPMTQPGGGGGKGGGGSSRDAVREIHSVHGRELNQQGPRDRVEDLLSSIVGLEHIKSQVRGLRRSAELRDLRESLVPIGTGPAPGSPLRGAAAGNGSRGVGSSGTQGPMGLVAPALAEDLGRPTATHMVFAGNPGTGKTAVARLLAKVFHELGLLRKPKFLEVERMDLVARDKDTTIAKTREVLEEARGGVLFIDEAFTLGMASRRNRLDTANVAMNEIARTIDQAANGAATTSTSASRTAMVDDSYPLIILAGFPLEMQAFLAFQPEIRKRFRLVFEFPDYTCQEIARIFIDLSAAKGFDMEEQLTETFMAQLLEEETTVSWRSERNGRVSEMLLTGVRTEVRKRMRRAQMEEQDDFDPHMIVRQDVENVVRSDFK